MADELHKQLLEALKKVDRPATFCTSGTLPATLPGLKVAGVGAIALPLEEDRAEALKKVAHQAPCGKGQRTVVDTSVRRVWEIDAGKVELTNPGWPEVLNQAISMVQSALGLADLKLSAHLYKLLLYEKGSFFLPHRDGEKMDRMVATLVIALPSAHKGGELIVRHEGREEIVRFAKQGQFQTQFAAFYADCDHEIRPVTAGFRLALVYNLALAKSKRTIAAPTSGEPVAAVGRILDGWKDAPREKRDAEKGGPKLAVLLDHEYTKAGLTIDALKGVDRARADVLFAAASHAGCDASLALVTYWQNGAAEGGYHEYGYRGYRRYETEDDDGEHEMGEIYDHSLTAEQFSDATGKQLDFGKVPLDESEIVSATPLTDGEPSEEEFEGYTGNAGMTLDRWYHHAAIVIWPAGSRFDVLCDAGIESAVGGLEQMAGRIKRAKKSEQAALRQQCIDFARRIIARWPERKFASRFRESEASKARMLPSLEVLDDASLVRGWLHGVLARDASIEPGSLLGDLCGHFGWAEFRTELERLYGNTSNETLERNSQLLADWSLRADKDADRRKLCATLADTIMTFVERWRPASPDREWQARRVELAKLLPPLVKSFVALNEPEILDRLVMYVLDRPREFDLTTVQVPALLELEAGLKKKVKRLSPPLRRWLSAALDELESRAANPPVEPADWRRASDTGCKCGDCQELSHFLDDPLLNTLRLPLAKARRQHLHGIIDSRKLDTTHTTLRAGSPQTLVCTKTTGSYERAVQAHKVDLRNLKSIRAMSAWHQRLGEG